MFIGSCTNSRLSDLRAAAGVFKGRKVAAGVRVLVVPGSQAIKTAAEAEGLDRVFRDAGAEWREAGCSMCIAMNGDQLKPGQYAVSTSNRNFEGRQGAGGRTFLASPLTGGGRRAITGRSRPTLRELGTEHGKVHTLIKSRTVVLPVENVDTDQIIPARFLKVTSKAGLGKQLFADWRYDADGNGEAGFRPEPARAAGARGAGRGRQLRLRIVARARAVGAGRLRLPRGGQHVDRRHLPQQLAQERPDPGGGRRRRCTPSCWRRLGRR